MPHEHDACRQDVDVALGRDIPHELPARAMLRQPKQAFVRATAVVPVDDGRQRCAIWRNAYQMKGRNLGKRKVFEGDVERGAVYPGCPAIRGTGKVIM